MEKNQCPRCGGGIPNDAQRGMYPGAISRWDNSTEVCSQCGVDEACAQWGVTDMSRESVLDAVHPVRGTVVWKFSPE